MSQPQQFVPVFLWRDQGIVGSLRLQRNNCKYVGPVQSSSIRYIPFIRNLCVDLNQAKLVFTNNPCDKVFGVVILVDQNLLQQLLSPRQPQQQQQQSQPQQSTSQQQQSQQQISLKALPLKYVLESYGASLERAIQALHGGNINVDNRVVYVEDFDIAGVRQQTQCQYDNRCVDETINAFNQIISQLQNNCDFGNASINFSDLQQYLRQTFQNVSIGCMP